MKKCYNKEKMSKQNIKASKSKLENASLICIACEREKQRKKMLQTDDLLWFKTSQLFSF